MSEDTLSVRQLAAALISLPPAQQELPVFCWSPGAYWRLGLPFINHGRRDRGDWVLLEGNALPQPNRPSLVDDLRAAAVRQGLLEEGESPPPAPSRPSLLRPPGDYFRPFATKSLAPTVVVDANDYQVCEATSGEAASLIVEALNDYGRYR